MISTIHASYQPQPYLMSASKPVLNMNHKPSSCPAQTYLVLFKDCTILTSPLPHISPKPTFCMDQSAPASLLPTLNLASISLVKTLQPFIKPTLRQLSAKPALHPEAATSDRVANLELLRPLRQMGHGQIFLLARQR